MISLTGQNGQNELIGGAITSLYTQQAAISTRK